MSSREPARQVSAVDEENPHPGPNLIVVYALLAAALIAAVTIAVLIVLPFYHRR